MQKSFLIKISKLISAFFNPLVSILIFFIWKEVQSNGASGIFHRFLPALLILLAPIALWIFWKVKTGSYTNFDVSDRKQRQSLYVFIEIVLGVFIIINRFYLIGNWDWDFISILILLVVMQISNFFIKSSMHTAFNVFVAALFFAENMGMGLLWLFITFLVALSRIILKRHTVAEVVAGFLIAAAVSAVYLFINIQINQ